jgi:hypothetical protein
MRSEDLPTKATGRRDATTPKISCPGTAVQCLRGNAGWAERDNNDLCMTD